MERAQILVRDLAKELGGEFEGDESISITRPAEPGFAKAGEIALAADPKFFEALKQSDARAAILPKGTDWKSLGLDAVIFVTSARKTMVELSRALEVPWSKHWQSETIHPSAIIAPSADIAKDVVIGPFSVIGENVRIGKGSVVHDHVTIAQSVSIAEDCQIYSGVRIGPEAQIGRQVIIMANSVIGADGFSYLTPNQEAIENARNAGHAQALSDLEIERINSLGTVELADRVEIGAGVMIDRGTLKNTKIGAGTKIDNLVHIAHNVVIGENCLICGQVGIAGSSTIGDRTILGGQVGVADHISVGSDVIAAGKSALSSTVPPKQVVMGNPAIKMASNIESYKAYRRLPKLFARVKQLEERIKNKDDKIESNQK